MDKLRTRFFQSKLVIFTIQILILSLLIYIFKYSFAINFDEDILEEQQIIIQFIANYVIFDFESYSSNFTIISWIIISLIPIFIYNDYKRAYSMNLTTFFFPNFFFYVFLNRYSANYFNAQIQTLFTNTIILGMIIVAISIVLSLILKKFKNQEGIIQSEGLKQLVASNRYKCPHCGAEFNSIPKYCYNCSKELQVLNGSE